MEFDDTALEDLLREAHQVHVDNPSEKACLSISRCPNERGGPVVERTGRFVATSGQELNFDHAQIRNLLDRQKEQILAECQTEINRHELQGEELQQRDQQLLHAQLLQQDCDCREVHENGLKEVEELKKFHRSTVDACKTKISRGPGHFCN